MRDSKNFLFPPALTIVFLAHCAGLFATPAQAQVITLVRNTGQLTHSHARCNVGINSGEKYSYAQGFTTGDNEDGYTLSQVVAVVSAFSDISPRISIYTGTGGKPDSNLYTLNNPGTFSTGDVTFTAPPNATLEKETKYFVVLEQTSTSGYYTLTGTGANNEDSGGVSGWSIADGRLTRIGSGQWAAISPFEIKIKIKGIVAGNNSPVFSTTSATLNFQETEGGATTRTAGNVGAAVVATDADNDTITYTLKKGTDADKFRIVRTTGRIRTKAGERYDYEAKESYSVTAKAKDGNGGTATIDLTIDITDQDEPPLQMQAPTVENPSGIYTALDIRGTAPENTGRPPITGYLYRWRRAGTASWTSRNSLTSLFRAVGLTSGREYELQVQAINDEGDGVWSPSATAHTTAPATGEPAISGTARVKQTLTADISNISDANGLANVVWIYRWRREDSDGSNSEDISGATSSAYVLAAADEGKKVRVGVSFTDDAGFDEVLTSDAYPSSGTILEALPPNTPATGAPTISGTPQEGETLTAATSGISDVNGLTTVSYSYQWIRVDSDGTSNAADIGTDDDEYTLVSTDEGKKIKVEVTFDDDDGNAEGPLTNNAYPSSGTIRAADTVVPPDTTRTGTIADAPQSLQAAPGDAQATLTWEAPLNDGGSEITGYAYRYKENGGIFGAWTDIPESATGEANETGYTVEGLTNGLEYTFEVRVENPNGGGIPARATVRLPVVVSTESEELPTELTLWDNYPNPFNPETVIDYVLPQTSHVRLAVYDMTGKTVAVLMDGIQPQGRHTARFNADGLPTGTYVYQLIAGAERLMRTMTLVR